MNFLQSLAAVVAGNVVYFLVMPYLPAVAQHNPARKLDLGVIVDFWICLVIWGVIKSVWKIRNRPGEQQRQ